MLDRKRNDNNKEGIKRVGFGYLIIYPFSLFYSLVKLSILVFTSLFF